MAATYGQDLGTGNNGAVGTSVVISPGKTVTAGGTILVGVAMYFNITATSVTDNLGNTYSRVERTRGVNQTCDLWAAPITTGGMLTTITVDYPSTQYVTAVAVEITGGTGPVAGGGLTGNGVTATWTDSKSIPTDGLAAGIVVITAGVTMVAGADSGTPLTAITRAIAPDFGLAMYIGLFYADTAVPVTGFSGTATLGSAQDWAGAGVTLSSVASAGGLPPTLVGAVHV